MSEADWYTDEMGWYADPTGVYEWRFFDGQRWMSYVIARGQLSFDPVSFESPHGSVADDPHDEPIVLTDTRPMPFPVNGWRTSIMTVTIVVVFAFGALALAALVAIRT